MSTRMSVLSSALLALTALTIAGLIGVGVSIGFAGDDGFPDETGGRPRETPYFQTEFTDPVTGGTCEYQLHLGLAPWNVHLTEVACPASRDDSCDYSWDLAFPSGRSAKEHMTCTPENADQPDCTRAHAQFPDRCPKPGGGSTNPSGGTGGTGGTNPPTGPAPGGGNVTFGTWGASTWTPAARPAPPPVTPYWFARPNTGWSQPRLNSRATYGRFW